MNCYLDPQWIDHFIDNQLFNRQLEEQTMNTFNISILQFFAFELLENLFSAHHV